MLDARPAAQKPPRTKEKLKLIHLEHAGGARRWPPEPAPSLFQVYELTRFPPRGVWVVGWALIKTSSYTKRKERKVGSGRTLVSILWAPEGHWRSGMGLAGVW
jgi:hypothetical protein